MLRPAIPYNPWSFHLWTPLVSPQEGRIGLYPCPQGCYMAQPHSLRLTPIIRSQKPNAYINVIILRPSYFPVPYCVWWSGRTPKAAVVFCLRPFPKASLCSSAVPWGTLPSLQWCVSFLKHFFSVGEERRWTEYTEYKIQVWETVLSKFHVFCAGLSQKLLNSLCFTLQHSWKSLFRGYVGCGWFHKWFQPVQDQIWESYRSSCLLFCRAQTHRSIEKVELLLKGIKLNL